MRRIISTKQVGSPPSPKGYGRQATTFHKARLDIKMKNYNEETFLDESNNTKGNLSNKTSFIIGFAALVIAFSPYKNLAEDVVVQLFGLSVSIYTLAGVFLLILFASIYLYGLNYIRYDSSRLLFNDSATTPKFQ